jgi:hypothetical protein
MNRRSTWVAAMIVLTFLCGGQSRADSLRLQCDLTDTDDPRQARRELWEITGASAFLDGHEMDNVTMNGSLLEITKEHVLTSSRLFMRVRIDRSTGKIITAWTDEHGVMKVRRTGTCIPTPAP